MMRTNYGYPAGQCGSKTVKNGVCTNCGFKPDLNKLFYSKKEWAAMVRQGMVAA